MRNADSLLRPARRRATCLLFRQGLYSLTAGVAPRSFILQLAHRRELIPGQRSTIKHASNDGHASVADPCSFIKANQVCLINICPLGCADYFQHFNHSLSVIGHLTKRSLSTKLNFVNKKSGAVVLATPTTP